MIQLLATRYRQSIAYWLLLIFYVSTALPGYSQPARHAASIPPGYSPYGGRPALPAYPLRALLQVRGADMPASGRGENAGAPAADRKADIGGPSQPEMSSFKSVGTDNMVNLFTGDFSYNIPLLDVGGYPVNIFYSGGIGMEQEASWVGLGWNINPGNVNRNMRGIPDDFNGQDTLVQEQKMKPNITWGVNVGADFELGGYKDIVGFSGSASLGVSFNNYLGPALELGIKGGVNLQVAKKILWEKEAGNDSGRLSVGVGLGANINSRYGFTLSPNVSLTASLFNQVRAVSNGLSLSTGYNSRNGIKALQLNDQVSYNRASVRNFDDREINMYSSGAIGANVFGTTISFARPSYVPALRMPVTNEAGSGHFQFGTGIFGAYGSIEAEVYKQRAEIADGDKFQQKPMVGYLYYEKAVSNSNAVMDFTRFNDNEVTPRTPIISAPQYSYDVFSLQGEGTGGTIRLYRNDMGYVKDMLTSSKDKSTSIGADVGIPGHYGANFNNIKTTAVTGEWSYGNKLFNTIGFTSGAGDQENVYFRNPGESSVLHPNQFNRIGGTDLVRFKLGGINIFPTLEPVLQRFSGGTVAGEVSVLTNSPAGRKKRTQVTSFLTAGEASQIGLNKTIKSYSAELLNADTLQYETIQRVSEYRKSHHISQINVTEADGKRYVYDIPVYNIIQKDFTFTVDATEISPDKVSFATNEAGSGSPHLSGQGQDGYVQITRTPAYAHSFLLGGLLSPDYVDVTGNGITEDDLGGAVKFNYTRVKQSGQWATHKWRTPLSSGTVANYNPGNRTEKKDDKGLVSYGERESWYLHSVESRTMIAFFTLEDRHDGKGATDSLSGINSGDNSLKRLKGIDLYNKADLKKNGLAHAKPVKSVHFGYNYSLCANTPDNTTSGEGKLTLERIWFTYNGQARANKNQYVFSYGTAPADNPSYAFAASDRWGTYKPAAANPTGMKNSDYPYALQDKTLQPVDQHAAAWSLKKILLPSGGQIEVEYESDDYAWVQNRRAAGMMEIAGFGKDAATITNALYDITGIGDIVEHDYVFVKVPEPCSTAGEVYMKYLQGQSQLAFKLAVNMPKGVEYVTSYATIAGYGVYNSSTIWVKLDLLDGLSPLSLTAIEYLRERLPGQAFPGYDVSENSGLQQIGDMLLGMLDALKSAFTKPLAYLRGQGKARTAVVERSFVRLNDPDGFKYGGGHRVRSMKLKDNWDKMTNQYGSVYGQEYDYTATEVFNGATRIISSGVASYEPSIGGEENPFQTIVQVANKLPLGPASYGAIEMPVLDAFFPAPLVGYSKVTVRSVKRDIPAGKKSRSGIGRQVTEFYTAKDHPVYYAHTPLDPFSDKREHTASTTLFLYKYAFDSRALSQGFLVATNDMHGKIKSQSSYAENDPATRINYSQHFYRNTGANGLNEKFDFAYHALDGEISEGNMGIDIELMTDTREFSVKSSSLEVQAQVDLFPVFFPFWLPFIWPVSGNSENIYRAVTTTKVINYHSILDSVVVIDKGSQVSTRNLVYDAETGAVIVSRTNNEFDKPVYSVSYPAYWAYSGMGPAYKNIDAVYAGVSFLDGKLVSGDVPESVFESGDELYIIDPGAIPSGCGAKIVSDASVRLVWAFDRNKNISSLTNTAPDYVFIDEKGRPYTRSGVKFRIVRSGKRNMLGAPAVGVTLMSDPVATVSGVRKLVIGDESKVISASAVEYREKWHSDKDVIGKYRSTGGGCNNAPQEIPDCGGYLEKSINPYRKGLTGSFRGYRSLVFYGDRAETDPAAATNLPQNGFLDDFRLYWDFNTDHNLVPDISSSKWVWNSQTTRYNTRGMELETKDALGIYTAAQYGYKQSLPVAITANSRYGEMFSEGFEDFGFGTGTLLETGVCADAQYIGFVGNKGGRIVNTDTLSFGAHTGKFVFRVNADGGSSTTYSKVFAVTPALTDSFSIRMVKDTTKTLSEPGGNWEVTALYPSALSLTPVSPTIGGMGMEYIVRHSNDTLINQGDQWLKTAFYSVKTFQYVEITSPGQYTIYMLARHDLGDPEAPMPASNGLLLTIRNLNGDIIGSASVNSVLDPNGNGHSFPFYLCPGIYKVEYNASSLYELTCSAALPPQANPCFQTDHAYDVFHASSDVAVNSYKSLTTENGCIFTRPVAATDSMLNPVFQVVAGKKMLFSAWVREECGDVQGGTPCTTPTFTNSKVRLLFDDDGNTVTELRPSGPIIEGWQRIEGEFTAPGGATQLTMSLVNTGSEPVCFDDIRIHPFHANMQSYVYDPVNLRLVAGLDANNYASFYEYDEEGTLIRTKAETKEGIKTITESRSAKQKNITTID